MIGYIIAGVIGLAAIVFAVRFFMRTAIMCQFCGNADCKVWDRVEEETQRHILAYFRSHERREPDTSGLFVCDECKTIFDDFSGEKANREVDYGWNKAWCKVCNHAMQGCGPGNANIECRKCGTRYEWKTHEESGYRFLMPPPDANLLERCSDLYGEI